MSDVFKVEYWDGCQYVIRVARCLRPGWYLVFDCYDNGAEYLITDGAAGHSKTIFSQVETVRILDSVMG